MAHMANQHGRIWKGAHKEIINKMTLILLSYLKMVLMYKKLPMGVAVYMSLYGGCIHNLGNLKGV